MKKILFILLLTIPFIGIGQTEYKDYHENGKLKYEGFIKDGNPHGFWKGYLENGQLEFEGNHTDGKKEGVWN